MLRAVRLAVIFALGAVVLAACGRPAPPAPRGVPAPPSVTSPSPPPESSPSTAPGVAKAPPVTEASLKSSAETAALKAAKAAAGADAGTLSSAEARIARDAAGGWWASVVVKASNPGVDELPVYLRFGAHGWQVVALGGDVDPRRDARLPAEVRGKL